MRPLRSYWQDLRARMLRDPLPPERVAAGWALGMFIGCTIPFGLQLMVSVPLSVLLRVSKIGATIGTLVTNPLSIVVLYPAQTWLGARVLGISLSWEYIVDICVKLRQVNLLDHEGWALLSRLSGQVLAGFFAGGLLLALVCTPLTYLIVLRTVVKCRSIWPKRNSI